MPSPVKIHYCGGLHIRGPKGSTALLIGRPACCYVENAKKIIQDGNQTSVVADVTCARCQKLIARAQADGIVGYNHLS